MFLYTQYIRVLQTKCYHFVVTEEILLTRTCQRDDTSINECTESFDADYDMKKTFCACSGNLCNKADMLINNNSIPIKQEMQHQIMLNIEYQYLIYYKLEH